MGIEALAAAPATRSSWRRIRQNLASLKLEARATVVTGPVLLTIPRYPASIVFLDPPYCVSDSSITG